MATFRKLYLKMRLWVLLIILLALPKILPTQYAMHVANLSLIFAIMSLSLNLLTGCTGLFSVGHVAFYGIGAYTSALLTTKLGVSVWFGFIAAGCVTALCSLILGLPSIRLRGLFLAVSTLAFGEITYQLLLNWRSLTNGSSGVIGIPAPSMFGFEFNTYQSYYYLILAALVVIIILSKNLIGSRVGRALLSIRENETASAAMGVNTTKFKIMIFMCSAFFAGLAGALYAHEVSYISPDSFKAAESTSVLAMMVVGGIGHLPGSILGGVLLTVIPELLRSFGDIRLVLYGAAIVVIVVFAPKGLGGLLNSIDDRIMGRKRSSVAKKPAPEDGNTSTEEV